MPPGAAAASSPLPLNGHRVNPLKVHPSAAVTRQSEAVGVRGGQWRRREKRRRRRRRQQEAVSGKSEAAARRQSSCTKSEAEDLGLGLSSFSHTRIENTSRVIKKADMKVSEEAVQFRGKKRE